MLHWSLPFGIEEIVGAPFKFGVPFDQIYEYPNVFAIEKTTGPDRLIVAPSANHISIMIELLQVMPAPFWILYLLTVPRGGGEAGRYESVNTLSAGEAEKFLCRFKDFFEKDGRHNIWIKSLSSPCLLVDDKHDVIYGYGQLPDFETILLNRGLSKVECIRFPAPHAHNFHPEFDRDEKDLLRSYPRKRSPLRESDD